MGVVLDAERRRHLQNWTGDLIIEDDYDAEHRYDRAPAPALYAMLPAAVSVAPRRPAGKAGVARVA